MAAKGALIALQVDVFAAGAFKATPRPHTHHHPQTDQIFSTCAGESMSCNGQSGWFWEILIYCIPLEDRVSQKNKDNVEPCGKASKFCLFCLFVISFYPHVFTFSTRGIKLSKKWYSRRKYLKCQIYLYINFCFWLTRADFLFFQLFFVHF